MRLGPSWPPDVLLWLISQLSAEVQTPAFEYELWAFLPRVTVGQQPARPASEQGDGNSADEVGS